MNYSSIPENKEIKCKYDKQYRKDNNEKISNNLIKYYIQNQERLLKKSREYRKNHPEVLLRNNIRILNKMCSIFDMGSSEYRYALQSWSSSIKKRDPYCKMDCGNKSQISHHILYKNKYPQLSLDLDNGVGLCKDCHYTYHNLNGWK